MNFSRRHFIGAMSTGCAAMLAPRAFAAVRSGERPSLLPRAMAALDRHDSRIAHRDIVGLVDFGAPSRTQRFFLVDIGNGKVITSHLVAHGRGSDPANSGWVEHLSNRPGSNASCEGSFLTGETYSGKHGKSRRLGGLDSENSLAEERAIVIHAASYVGNDMARSQGRIGRSQGCFAVAPNEIGAVLDGLGAGRLLFASK